jgi:hypothetical protein
MKLQTSVVRGAPAKCNQPRCIKIVKWFFISNFAQSGQYPVKLNRSVERLVSLPKLRRARRLVQVGARGMKRSAVAQADAVRCPSRYRER